MVTTRSKVPQEPYPIIDENSSELSIEELRDNMNEDDPRNKLLVKLAVLITNSTPTALSRVELVQPVPIFLPTPPAPPRPFTILERTPLATNSHNRPMEVRTKPTPYQIPHIRNLKPKSSSKQPRVMELAKGL